MKAAATTKQVVINPLPAQQHSADKVIDWLVNKAEHLDTKETEIFQNR